MPANKYALLRYRIIDRCLTNPGKPFPTKEDLRQACEDALYGSDGEHISISTVEKDLWAMRNEADLGYYAPIEYHRDERGYHYTEEGYSINDGQLKGVVFEKRVLERALEGNKADIPVEDLVDASYCTVDGDTEITVLTELFRRFKVAIVLDDKKHPVDIITRIDLIDFISETSAK